MSLPRYYSKGISETHQYRMFPFGGAKGVFMNGNIEAEFLGKKLFIIRDLLLYILAQIGLLNEHGPG